MDTSPGSRGKFAEGKLRDQFKLLEAECATFAFNRIPDAHAAGGRAQSQAGDFQAFKKALCTIEANRVGHQFETIRDFPMTFNWIIEAKEVKHDFRLPHKNYSPDAVARMKVRVLAGSIPVVFIYHTTIKEWRLVPFEVFLTREGGSWDLTPYPLVDMKVAVREIFGFPAKLLRTSK